MMIANANDPEGKRNILIIGLSNANLAQLMAGKPAFVNNTKTPGSLPEGMEIVIVYGETEQDMHEIFRKRGLIGPETKVNVDPRLA